MGNYAGHAIRSTTPKNSKEKLENANPPHADDINSVVSCGFARLKSLDLQKLICSFLTLDDVAPLLLVSRKTFDIDAILAQTHTLKMSFFSRRHGVSTLLAKAMQHCKSLTSIDIDWVPRKRSRNAFGWDITETKQVKWLCKLIDRNRAHVR